MPQAARTDQMIDHVGERGRPGGVGIEQFIGLHAAPADRRARLVHPAKHLVKPGVVILSPIGGTGVPVLPGEFQRDDQR